MKSIVTRDRRRGDRDPALLLLLHEVHRRTAVVHLADAAGDPGVEQHPLGDRGLAGVDVGGDADVAGLGDAHLVPRVSSAPGRGALQ
jgi:hypothetical protein